MLWWLFCVVIDVPFVAAGFAFGLLFFIVGFPCWLGMGISACCRGGVQRELLTESGELLPSSTTANINTTPYDNDDDGKPKKPTLGITPDTNPLWIPFALGFFFGDLLFYTVLCFFFVLGMVAD